MRRFKVILLAVCILVLIVVAMATFTRPSMAGGLLNHFGSIPAQDKQAPPGSVAQHKLDVLRFAWKSRVPQLFGKDWQLDDITIVSAPADWRRTAGGGGIAIHCTNPTETYYSSMTRSTYHPGMTLFLMPLNWQGTNTCDKTERLVKSGYCPSDGNTTCAYQTSPAFYLGRAADCHVFTNGISGEHPVNVRKILFERFQLRVN